MIGIARNMTLYLMKDCADLETRVQSAKRCSVNRLVHAKLLLFNDILWFHLYAEPQHSGNICSPCLENYWTKPTRLVSYINTVASTSYDGNDGNDIRVTD